MFYAILLLVTDNRQLFIANVLCNLVISDIYQSALLLQMFYVILLLVTDNRQKFYVILLFECSQRGPEGASATSSWERGQSEHGGPPQ